MVGLGRLTSVTLIAGAMLAILAAPAAASKAELVSLFDGFPCKDDPSCVPPPPDTALVYLGGGEGNRVSLTADAQQVRISDPAVQIEPGPGCSRVGDHSVSCSVPNVLVYVAAGAGRDRVRSELGSQTKLTVDGGTGNDVLVGGRGPDALLGGGGADRLRGHDGDDRLFDASSNRPLRADDQTPGGGTSDVFFPASRDPGRGRDSFDGGGGNDTVSYEGRSEKLRIDLAGKRPIAGARGERDSVRRVENATGGAGADRIAGDRKANRLLGGGETPRTLRGGDDRIAGRAGADSIEGGAGRNLLSGGPGNDSITLGASGRGERAFCGAGTDSVGSPLRDDFLAADCERPLLAGLIDGKLQPPVLISRLPLRKGRPPIVLSGRLRCFLDQSCQPTVEVRVRGRGTRRGTSPPRGTLLGSESLNVGARETRSFDLRLSPTGLRLLRRHRSLLVGISVFAAPRPASEPPDYLTLLRAP